LGDGVFARRGVGEGGDHKHKEHGKKETGHGWMSWMEMGAPHVTLRRSPGKDLK